MKHFELHNFFGCFHLIYMFLIVNISFGRPCNEIPIWSETKWKFCNCQLATKGTEIICHEPPWSLIPEAPILDDLKQYETLRDKLLDSKDWFYPDAIIIRGISCHGLFAKYL